MRNITRLLLPLLICLFGGVICTIVIAIIVALFSPQPTQWRFFNENTANGDSTYWSLASAAEPDFVVVMTSRGLGYRSLDIRYYDADEVATFIYPPEKRREFMTELGWPNAAFATNTRGIGLRFGAELGPNSPSDDAVLDDGMRTTVRILWPGLCLNSLLLMTVFLMPWVFFRWHADRYTVSRIVVNAMCVGLWLVLLTAWTCDLMHNIVPFLPREYEHYDDPIAFDSAVYSIDIPPSTTWNQFSGYVYSSIGYCQTSEGFSRVVLNISMSYVMGESLLSPGWHVFCLKGTNIGYWQDTGDPRPVETKYRHVFALMALPVWWPGILINWMFYTLVIVMIMRGPVVIRRFYRRRRNLCPMCGYPVGESDRCSECGQLYRGRTIGENSEQSQTG